MKDKKFVKGSISNWYCRFTSSENLPPNISPFKIYFIENKSGRGGDISHFKINDNLGVPVTFSVEQENVEFLDSIHMAQKDINKMKVRSYRKAVTNTDSYKVGHYHQYPTGTELVFSNMTPRGRKYFPTPEGFDFEGVLVFGIKAAIQGINELWEDTFFSQPKEEVVGYYKQRMDVYLGKDAITVNHIEALHDLGYLPIEFRSLEEGTLCPIGVPVFSLHNTVPEFYWVVNYLETALSNETWLPMTTATTSHTFRRIVNHYSNLTGTDNKAIDDFICHDFSMRGLASGDAAAKSSAAFLTCFTGTDALPAVDFIEYFYDTLPTDFIAGSIPATEHSVMCMGTKEGEFETYRSLIEDKYPNGIVAIVSDTWDFWNVVTNFLPKLKPSIMARNGKVVCRPDSGVPEDILCGYTIFDSKDERNIKDYTYGIRESFVIHDLDKNVYTLREINYDDEVDYDYRERIILECEAKGLIETLWNIFGGTINEKGYQTLDSHIGAVYGDSITLERAAEIFKRLEAKGFAYDNVVLAMGSYSAQMKSRDSLGFAVKATAGKVNGEYRSLMKDPITDLTKEKKSAKGFLKVVKEDGVYKLQEDVTFDNVFDPDNELKVIFKDGEIVESNVQNFLQIRENVKRTFK